MGYTPTIEELRDVWEYRAVPREGITTEEWLTRSTEALAEFDRFIAKVKVKAEAKASGLREAAKRAEE